MTLKTIEYLLVIAVIVRGYVCQNKLQIILGIAGGGIYMILDYRKRGSR